MQITLNYGSDKYVSPHNDDENEAQKILKLQNAFSFQSVYGNFSVRIVAYRPVTLDSVEKLRY